MLEFAVGDDPTILESNLRYPCLGANMYGALGRTRTSATPKWTILRLLYSLSYQRMVWKVIIVQYLPFDLV